MEFNALFGMDYTIRECNNGYYYMDNITITYNYPSQFLCIEYTVVHKNKHGKRSRNRPPY